MAMSNSAPHRALNVFLCHASDDKGPVRDLCQQLRAEGFDPWLDEERLLPGQEWDLEIKKAVRSADVVIVCLSSDAVTKSGYVQKEIRFVLDVAEEKPQGSTFVIPVKLAECRVPEHLRRWQWGHLMDAHGFDKLVYALRVQEEVRGLLMEELRRKDNATTYEELRSGDSAMISSEPLVRTEESVFDDRVFGGVHAEALRTLRQVMDIMDSPPIGNAAIPAWAAELPRGLDTQPIADNAMVLNATIQSQTNTQDPNAYNWCITEEDSAYRSIDGLWNSRWQITSPSSSRRDEGWHEGTATLRMRGPWVFIKYEDSTNTYFIRARRIGLHRLVGRYLNGQVDDDTTSWVGIVVNNRRIDGFWFSPDHGRWDFRR